MDALTMDCKADHLRIILKSFLSRVEYGNEKDLQADTVIFLDLLGGTLEEFLQEACALAIANEKENPCGR